MGIISSIIGGATSLIGGLIGGKKVNEGYNEAIEMYNNRLADIKNHRDAIYYQDPTQQTDNQAVAAKARELLQEQTDAAKAGNIVTGGTNESLALQKRTATKAMGDMLQQQAAEGAAKKEQAYTNADSQINAMTQYIASTKLGKAKEQGQAITQAASGLAGAASLLPW